MQKYTKKTQHKISEIYKPIQQYETTKYTIFIYTQNPQSKICNTRITTKLPTIKTFLQMYTTINRK